MKAGQSPPGGKEKAVVLPGRATAAFQDTQQAHLTSDGQGEATVEAAVLAVLQRRLAQFKARLQPMCGDGLLLSRIGAISRVVPDLRAARQILRQWEGQ